MKPITLPIAELGSALLGLGKLIPPRPSLAILGNIKVERTADGWIALTSTDLDHYLTVRLEHPAEGPATAVLVPYERLQHLTKHCGRNEQLHIEQTPQRLLIRLNLVEQQAVAEIDPVSVDEFPKIPRVKMEPVSLSPDIRKSVIEALNCSSTDDSRPVLNGVFIDLQNPKAGHIVASDGKHLYSANSFTLPLKNSVLLPNHKFLKWTEFNRDGEWQLRSDHEFIQISSRRWRFISKQIDGKYPNWRATVPNPEAAKTHITIDPAKLEAVIRLVLRLPSHDERFHSIGLEWKNGQALFLVKDTDNEPWTKVPVPDSEGAGPEMTVFFNRQFLIKALEYGLNTISLISFVSPIRFHNQGKQMIVMPLRLGDQLADQPPQPQTPQEPTPMIKASPPQTSPSEEPKTAAMEEAIDLTLKLRDTLNAGFNMLRDLSGKLKLINREQRTNAKEFGAVRSTLRSLQSLRI